MKFSIVTVSFNSEKTISETLESVLNQTYSGAFQYLIKDGGSTDNTLTIAEQYCERFAERGVDYRIVSEKDAGIFDAMNIGIDMTDGDMVGLINSDDYYAPNALKEVVDFYESEPFDLMYADLRIFGEGRDFIKKSKSMPKKFTTRHWNHPTMFVSREVYNRIKYDTECGSADLNFVLEARNKGYKIRVLNKTLANFRLGGVSNKKTWAQTKLSIADRNEIYRRNGCKHYKFDNWFMEVAKYFLTK